MGKGRQGIEVRKKQKLLIMKDMKVVKALAGNNQRARNKALTYIKEWLKVNSEMRIAEDNYLYIWKALFYMMWMSDKPLVQEECAESIANLIHSISENSGLLFFKCGLKLLAMQWFGIDQWRLDKFLMFVRRLLRQALVFLRNHNWNSVKKFTCILSRTVLTGDSKCVGLTMHITEIYLEELAKVSRGEISSDLVLVFVKPFIKYLSRIDDDRQIKHTIKCLFYHLMQQSDVGLDHDERFSAWEKEGFPSGSIDVMEKTEVDDDSTDDSSDNDEKELDPRAGQVDVHLPQLQFDVQSLLHLFHHFKFKKYATTNGKKALSQLHEQFEKLQKGSYPLGMTTVPQVKEDNSTKVHISIDRLMEFDQLLRQDKKQFNKKLRDETKGKPKKTKLNNFDSNIFADKLNAFIKKSEGNLRVKPIALKRQKAALGLDWSYENSFKRNSGLWKVHRLNVSNSSTESTPTKNIGTPIPRKTLNGFLPKKVKSPADEWKEPLQQGETEIFVLSNKFKAKMNAQNKPINGVINNIKTPPLIKNNLARMDKSNKKVRIVLKLNKSQEMHEHEAQLKSSPGIPYDATRKPIKPLLKPNCISSPINPFYKQKLTL